MNAPENRKPCLTALVLARNLAYQCSSLAKMLEKNRITPQIQELARRAVDSSAYAMLERLLSVLASDAPGQPGTVQTYTQIVGGYKLPAGEQSRQQVASPEHLQIEHHLAPLWRTLRRIAADALPAGEFNEAMDAFIVETIGLMELCQRLIDEAGKAYHADKDAREAMRIAADQVAGEGVDLLAGLLGLVGELEQARRRIQDRHITSSGGFGGVGQSNAASVKAAREAAEKALNGLHGRIEATTGDVLRTAIAKGIDVASSPLDAFLAIWSARWSDEVNQPDKVERRRKIDDARDAAAVYVMGMGRMATAEPKPAGVPTGAADPATQDSIGPAPGTLQKPKATHSEDFTSVEWYGREYTFALGVQSSAVQALWIEWEKTGLGLHQETICRSIDAERANFRMDKAFRNNPAFGTMIQSMGNGKYKLEQPTSDKTATAKKKKISARIPTKARQKPR